MRRAVDLSKLLSSEAISHTRLADHSGVILDIAGQVPQFPVDANGDCVPRQTLADRSGNFEAGYGTVERSFRAVR